MTVLFVRMCLLHFFARFFPKAWNVPAETSKIRIIPFQLYSCMGKKDPVSGFGKGIRKVYKAYKENNPDTEIRSFPGTHDILHDSGCEALFKEIEDFIKK